MNDDQCKVVVADNNVGVDIAVAAVEVVGIDGCIDNDDQYMVVAALDNNAVAVVVVGIVVAVDVDNISDYDLMLEVWESLFCKFQKPVPRASAGERVFPLYSTVGDAMKTKENVR